MIFWDSSSVLPLLVAEETSASAADLLRTDPAMAIWWATRVECVSALARLERESSLSMEALVQALRRVDRIESGSVVVEPAQSVKNEAQRLLRRYDLRAADALQLAAACVLRDQAGPLDFASEDQRLIAAAFREGFAIRRIR